MATLVRDCDQMHLHAACLQLLANHRQQHLSAVQLHASLRAAVIALQSTYGAKSLGSALAWRRAAHCDIATGSTWAA